MGAKINAILMTVVILGVVLYIFNSGIINKGAQGLVSLFPHNSSTTTSTSFINPVIGPTIPPGPAPSPSPTPGSGTGTPHTIDPSQIPAGFTAAELSPYFGEIRFSGAYGGTYGPYGQISISATFSQNETIDITGWQIKTRYGGEFLPQAISVYDPSGLTPPSDIRLKPGDTVSIYSSSAPFNLRLNECVGYLQHAANFKPQLPGNCPGVNQSEIQSFTGACVNYIQSLGGCSQPDLSSPYVPQNDYACRDYLSTHFNYGSCFNEHRGDANFLGNQVWVWTGSDPLDRYHDQVELLDTKGLLVDIFKY